MKSISKKQIMGVRASDEFLSKFDQLCYRLGHNRSEVIRYCLKRFLNEHWNNTENFQKARKEMF